MDISFQKYVFPFFVVFNSSNACNVPNVREIYSIDQANPVLAGADDHTLVGFDVDDTLFYPADVMCRRWFKETRFGKELCKKHDDYINSKENPQEYRAMILSKIGKTGKSFPVEANTAATIYNLLSRGVKVIAVSNCLTGSHGVIESYQKWRFNRLVDLGMDFSTSFGIKKIDLQKFTATDKKPVFYKGICLTDWINKGKGKGTVIGALLDATGFRPNKIIFFDDGIEHCSEVQDEAERRGIPHQIFHYRAAERLPLHFDRRVIKLQYKNLIEQDEHIIEEQARNKLKNVVEEEEPRHLIHRAAKNGDIASATKVFMDFGAINAVNWLGDCEKTPLILAAEHNQPAIVKFLLEQGALINLGDHWELSPLHYAVYNKNNNIVRLLLAHGADANKADRDGQTPMHLAAAAGSKSVILLLLLHGGKNLSTPDGISVAETARSFGHPDLVPLIENGIQITTANDAWDIAEKLCREQDEDNSDANLAAAADFYEYAAMHPEKLAPPYPQQCWIRAQKCYEEMGDLEAARIIARDKLGGLSYASFLIEYTKEYCEAKAICESKLSSPIEGINALGILVCMYAHKLHMPGEAIKRCQSFLLSQQPCPGWLNTRVNGLIESCNQKTA